MVSKDKSRLDWRKIEKLCGGTRKVVALSETVFCQGDPADQAYYLLSGRVKVTIISEHGKEGVIGIFHHGELLGDERLRDHELYTATATALSEGELICLPATGIKRALQTDQHFALWMTRFLLRRVERLESDIIDHLFNSAEQRLARLLMRFAGFEEAASESILSGIDQQTLARMVGTTRPRISQFMNKFRKNGYIQYSRGRITVNSSLLNAVLSDPKDCAR